MLRKKHWYSSEEGHNIWKKNIFIALMLTKLQIDWEILSVAFLENLNFMKKTEFTTKQIVFLCFTWLSLYENLNPVSKLRIISMMDSAKQSASVRKISFYLRTEERAK